MKLIIVRHGETEKNINQIHQDAETPLNETGRAQAHALAGALAAHDIQAVYVSDFMRTQETAGEVLKHHPLAEVVHTPELRERNVGIFIGRPYEESDLAIVKSGLLFYEFRPQDGESLTDLQKRVLAFYKKIIEQHRDGTVLFVTHHGVMATLLLHLTDKTLNDYSSLIIGNTAITVLEIDGNKNHTVQILNNTDHLAGLA